MSNEERKNKKRTRKKEQIEKINRKKKIKIYIKK